MLHPTTTENQNLDFLNELHQEISLSATNYTALRKLSGVTEIMVTIFISHPSSKIHHTMIRANLT